MPTAESIQVPVEQDETGSVLVRLTGEGDAGGWKLKDERNDILVERKDGDILDIKLNFTLPDGSAREVHSRMKVQPGEKVRIGRCDEKKVLIEPVGRDRPRRIVPATTRRLRGSTAWDFQGPRRWTGAGKERWG